MTHHQFVDQPDSLASSLELEEHVGVDTEFMREKTYFAQLCLVQVAIADDIYCVDPLVTGEHREFWDALLARDWVVHSARQDIEVIVQTAGAMPASIFDTQIAAGLLGHPPQMGYAGLVNALFGVEMAKSHTRADWTRRPLRKAWLEYAAEDVEYLLPAYRALCERLQQAGRLQWALEDSSQLLNPGLYDVSAEQAIERLKGARNLRGRRRAAAARLAAWREKEAVGRNLPRQWIAKDNVLMEIATRLPASPGELERLDGVPPKLASRVGKTLLRAVADSATDDSDYRPPSAPTERQKALLKEMQSRVAASAGELGLAAETVASKRELSAVIISGNHDSRLFTGWRREIIGEELLTLL